MVDRSASHEPAHVLRFTSSDPVAKKAEAVAIDRNGNKFHIIKGVPTAVGSVAPMTRRASAELETFTAARYQTLAVAYGPRASWS